MSSAYSRFQMADDRTLGRDTGSGRHCYSLRSTNSLSSGSDLVSNASNTSSFSSSVTCSESIIYPRPGSCQSPVNSVQSHNRPSSLAIRSKNSSLQTDLLEEDDAMPSTAGLRGKKRRKKFVGVRQRPSGRWVAEIKDTTQKIRLWLGTFDCAEDAARAYDEAACLLRGNNARTNFVPHPSAKTSPLASKVAQMLHVRRHHVRSSGCAIPKIQLSSSHSQGGKISSTRQQPLFESPSSDSDNDDDNNMSLTASPTGSMASAVCTVEDSPGFELWAGKDRANLGDVVVRERSHKEAPKPTIQSSLKFRKGWEMRSSRQQEESDQKQESFTEFRQENLIQISTEKEFNEEPILKLQRGGYMDAVLGLNDDILGSAEMDLASQIEAAYDPPAAFDFCVESSTMQVDDFPLISELSEKLEKADKTNYGEGSDNSEEINDETIKRMRFERRFSASLYALTGVHELMMKQSHHFAAPSSSSELVYSSPCKLSSSTNSSACDTNLSGAPSEASSAITFPLVAENSDQEALWNSWDLSPLCPLYVA